MKYLLLILITLLSTNSVYADKEMVILETDSLSICFCITDSDDPNTIKIEYTGTYALGFKYLMECKNFPGHKDHYQCRTATLIGYDHVKTGGKDDFIVVDMRFDIIERGIRKLYIQHWVRINNVIPVPVRVLKVAASFWVNDEIVHDVINGKPIEESTP